MPILAISCFENDITAVAGRSKRPGGMVTGLTNITADVVEKYLELLLDTAPKLRRIGFLADPNNLNLTLMMEAVRRSIAKRAVEARFAEASGPDELELAISRLAKEGTEALVVISSAMFRVEGRRIVKLALARRWPVIAGQREWADKGALLSYSAVIDYRRAAYYVDRILKGTKPGDLPIEQPTKFELVINLKTARAIGVTIRQDLLLRADKVIE